MRYCTRCIIPDSRPNIHFDVDGECQACKSFDEKKTQIDWVEREKQFKVLVDSVRSLKHSSYDCLIPVSGGKDSTWQVITCLEYGLKPLAVTWKSPGRTAIGQKNLDNLKSLCVDHIDFQVSPRTERLFTKKAFLEKGAAAIPMHYGIYNIPLKLAVQMKIPLIVWGENSAFEYGDKNDSRLGCEVSQEWLKRWGVMNGEPLSKWSDSELTERDLSIYESPSDQEFKASGTKAIFLGYYFEWDPVKTFTVANKYGFQAASARTGTYEFADIDDDFISIHHFLKWYKFGFSRAFDNLSIEIRYGRMTRAEAVEKLKLLGFQVPTQDIEKFCLQFGIKKQEFWATCEKFRNKKIWKQKNDQWKIDDFLIPDWRWNELPGQME